MLDTSMMLRWVIWVMLVLTPFTHVHATIDNQKLQRLRKKKHFRQKQHGSLESEAETATLISKEEANEIASETVGQFHPGEPSAAYVKCRSSLEGVAGDDSSVSKPEYVRFLDALTGGNIKEDSFDDLSDPFTIAFYQAACVQGRQCDGEYGSILLENSEESYELISRFCDRVMGSVYTKATTSFGYNIRYDTDQISKEALPSCLEKATTYLLLDNFGCQSDLQEERRVRQRNLRRKSLQSKSSTAMFESEEERLFAELLIREQEDRRFLNNAMSMDTSCEYTIDVNVPSILDLGEFECKVCIPA